MQPPRLQHLYALILVACSGAGGSSLLDGQDASIGDTPDASTSNDASASDGGPTDASKGDAQPVKDAGNPYVDPGIACGTAECDAGAQLCCATITSYYPKYTYAFACESTSALVQCSAGIGIYCDDDHDCDGGQVCCGDLGNASYAKVSCKPTCTGIVFGYQQIHFCNPKAPDCTTTQTCVASTVMPGYFVCQ